MSPGPPTSSGTLMIRGSSRGAIDKLPTKSMGAFGSALKGLAQGAKGAESALGTIDKMFEIFMPFINENCYTFIARNIDALQAATDRRLSLQEQRSTRLAELSDAHARLVALRDSPAPFKARNLFTPAVEAYIFSCSRAKVVF